MKACFKIIPRHLIPIIIGLVFMAAAFTTQLSTWNQLTGLNPAGSGGVSAVDLIEAASLLPARVEGDFNNHFNGHDRLVHLDYWFRMNALAERDFHDVLIGKQGWLYYTGERNMDYYQGADLLSDQQVDELISGLVQTQDELARQNIRFYLVVAPDKESIYPEYLPDEIHPINRTRLLDRILTAGQGQTLHLIDLRPALLQAKEKSQVYYRTDTHWNPEGAFAAYKAVIGYLRKDFPQIPLNSISDFQKTPEVISGDLAGMLTMRGILAEDSIELEPLFKRRVQTELTDNADVRKSTGGDPSLPRAMIFHDSFFNGLQPFLMESFSEAILVHSFNVDMEWVQDEKPDIVVLEVAERYLPQLQKGIFFSE